MKYTHQCEAQQNAEGAWEVEIRTFVGELVTRVYSNDKSDAESRARAWVEQMNDLEG